MKRFVLVNGVSKESQMKLNTLTLALTVFGIVLRSVAGTFNYNFAGSGSWADSSRWKEGGRPGVSGDQIRIGSGTVVAADGDLEILKNVGTVVLTQVIRYSSSQTTVRLRFQPISLETERS